MGHIVNAKRTRFGRVLKWLDSWFANSLYYAQYCYMFLRIRYFFIFYHFHFMAKKEVYIFSHFKILKLYKRFLVEFYYYDGVLETFFNELEINLRNFRHTIHRTKRYKALEAKVIADFDQIYISFF